MSNKIWEGKWNDHVGFGGREFLPYTGIKMEYSVLPIKLLVLVHILFSLFS